MSDKEKQAEILSLEFNRLMELAKANGINLDELPPLSDEDRDVLDTALHNARRTRKFSIPDPK